MKKSLPETKRGFSGRSVFLSHSHADKEFVKKLANDLSQKGIRVWRDEAEMKVGDSLLDKISEAIDETDYLGVVLSKSSVRSRWVMTEVKIAMTKEIMGKQVKVLPLLLENCKIPNYLRGKIYADFRNPIEYEDVLTRIVMSVMPASIHHPEASSTLGISGIETMSGEPAEWANSLMLDELQRLPNQDAVTSFLRQRDTDALLVLVNEIIERLSLVHDYKQFETCRNLLTAIRLAPMSRDNDIDKRRIFKRIQGYVADRERPLIGIEYFYAAILSSLDDLAIKEYVLKNGIVDYYISDFENATSFEDAKVRAKVIALFANKLTKSQKLRIVSAIVAQNQVLECFGAQSALRSVIETVRDDIPKEHIRTLKEHTFVKR
jgi:hypothetical protein